MNRWETAHLGDEIGARSFHQVIGVGQHDWWAEPIQILGVKSLDCGSSAYRHEDRCRHRAPLGCDGASSSGSVGVLHRHTGLGISRAHVFSVQDVEAVEVTGWLRCHRG